MIDAAVRVRRWGCEHEPTDRRLDRAVYVISVAAELAGVHPQTLRVYERKGLLDPSRTSGRQPALLASRTWTACARSRSLTNEGLNLEGVRRVLELEAEVARLRAGAGGHPGRRPGGGGRDPPPVPQGPGAAVAAARPDPHDTTTPSWKRRFPMSLNPERWTLKTQEALAAAVERARDASNAEVTPDHLLAAVLDQTDGIAGPILTRVGVEPGGGRARIGEQLGRLPQAFGGAEPSHRPRRCARPSRPPTASASTWGTSTCRSSTCCWPWPTGSA